MMMHSLLCKECTVSEPDYAEDDKADNALGQARTRDLVVF